MRRRDLVRGLVVAVACASLADPVLAHSAISGGLTSTEVPFWLVALSGGGVVGASFLFTSFATDHAFIRSINDRDLGLPSSETVGRWTVAAARTASVALLGLVVAVGLVGPPQPQRNLAVLGVWGGWWAGYTMTVYLVGNTWPGLNPWRALAGAVSRSTDSLRELPARYVGWPATVGLVALVWVEVVSPVASAPRLLAGLVVAYSAVTLTGAFVFGDAWFRHVDPISRVFRTYGWLAPVRRTDDGLTVELPGAALVRRLDETTDGDVYFVVALVWVTSYDGLVSTPPFAAFVRRAADVGVPALAVYLGTAVVGFAGFLGIYKLAARLSRRTAGTYVGADVIERRFVPSLVPIAAGYHLAHFLGYFLTFTPALSVVAADPFAPPPAHRVPVAILPDWFGAVGLAFIVLGHLLAIWVAHAIAFETFTGRLQPIRSQYPFALVMVFYTITSMWLLSQPYVDPALL
ncbi:hypothetical protein [Haloarchaeobius sp. HRN-SO-5]|uniref:hypothetical protein n=1 Tax=Haloarchaeobius sp. HRN-SO-5 TaxID=3446118 RepID=UPI003EBED05C